MNSRFARTALILLTTAIAAPSWAQAGDVESVPDSVVVIAPDFVPVTTSVGTKTSAPLIEVPQSVSVVTRDQIDLLNFIDVQQAVRYTAGITGENYGPDLRYDFLTVRGFIPVQYIDGLQAPVSASISNVGIDLYGFQSLEVLKGPASVLYGTNPPGGLYNLTSRRPDAAFGGELQVKYGNDDFKQAAGTVTGALTDGVRARVTGLYRDRDSQTDFVHAKRAYLAPALAVDIGPDTVLTGLGHYQHDRIDGDTNGFLPVLGVLRDNPVGEVPRSVNLGEPDYNSYRRNQFSAGYELVHDFGTDARFTQNARWSEYHEDQRTIYASGLGADNRTVTRSNFPYQDDVAQFAVDSRLEATRWTGPVQHSLLVGVDYRNYREASAFGFGAASSIDLFEPVYGQGTIVTPALTPSTDQRLRQTGVYVQDQLKYNRFVLTLSGRQDWTWTTNYAGAVPSTAKQDKFSYRVGGSYIADSGVAPYVSYATSFQPVVGQGLDGRAFDPTSGKQWEAGVKYDACGLPSDVKLFATAAVYRLRQDNVVTPDPTNILFNVQTGQATVKGVELEAVTRIRDRLSINASYTYADAKVTRSNVAGQVGAGLFGQPKHKASAFVDYSFRDGALSGFGLGGGVRYLSNSPGALPGPFVTTVYNTGRSTLFDAVLRYDLGDWRVALNGTNLLDKRYAGRCTGDVGCFFGQSRQVIATLTRRF
ncbi:TonB-dependent siderophore receptor [Sphingomonas prati]|uniref:Iron complex outermembrane receptor protein n=1 Tax=Sphingomonas prati TaxID=1843237 RepID=A0A7W9F264_9SPHN|nr:TonB-dependent siderophore receptor [Sphingomonas prati]MBB5729991.1 iron complex outermembrane receptor protein [Sphingomonas prati]GGE90568.1 TonB-dependent receptor [Sphingomonas prati]